MYTLSTYDSAIDFLNHMLEDDSLSIAQISNIQDQINLLKAKRHLEVCYISEN